MLEPKQPASDPAGTTIADPLAVEEAPTIEDVVPIGDVAAARAEGEAADAPLIDVLRNIGPNDAGSVPVPLIVLTILCGLLAIIGGTVLAARHVQARRLAESPPLPPRTAGAAAPTRTSRLTSQSRAARPRAARRVPSAVPDTFRFPLHGGLRFSRYSWRRHMAVEAARTAPQIDDAQLENTVVDQERSCGVDRYFTIPGRDPFEEIEWETRDALIPGVDGPAFEQKGVEFPKFWTQTATNIVAQKYFRGRLGSPERETSVKQMIGRVVETIGAWGREGGYLDGDEEAETFEAELKAILVNQLAAFNSPVWFNVGFESKPQCSACFILSIEDSMESILDWIRREGIVFRGGSGSGVNLSRLRSSHEQLSKGGHASGPVSFMRGADASAGTIKSGGKTRRAAKMVVLDVDHPDVEEFVWCKAQEEEKARVLREAGYDMSLNSPHWASIQYQNANNSVRVTDQFMEAAEEGADWSLGARTDGTVVKTLDASQLLHQIADAAWRCADPGVQYDTTINAWHTCPNSGRINASNPCSEYMHIDDSACNLASLNLMKFRREDGELDTEAFEHAVDVVLLAQEIVVGYSSYPTPEIEKNARAYRQLGLGYANLGALLMARGLPYDSNEGRAYAAAITALMTGRAYRKSAQMASRMGAFAGYRANTAAMLGVMAKHRAAVGNIENAHTVPQDLLTAARQSWDDVLDLGEVHGYRNAQATVLAPTGTISFMMDCDTTGVEPDFSLAKSKKLVGGGEITIVNRTVPMALEKLGYSPGESGEIVAYIDERNGIVGAPYVKTEHYPVFDCAIGDRAIHYMGHVKMMGAVQPFISGAISKTVNMPESVTVDDVAALYSDAWKARRQGDCDLPRQLQSRPAALEEGRRGVSVR